MSARPELGEDSKGRPIVRIPLVWCLAVRVEEEDVGNGTLTRRAFVPQGQPYIEDEDGTHLVSMDGYVGAAMKVALLEAVSEMEPERAGRGE